MKLVGREEWDKLHVVRCGIDFTRLDAPTPPPAPDTPLRVLTVGRLVPDKGQTQLVEAVARLGERGSRSRPRSSATGRSAACSSARRASAAWTARCAWPARSARTRCPTASATPTSSACRASPRAFPCRSWRRWPSSVPSSPPGSWASPSSSSTASPAGSSRGQARRAGRRAGRARRRPRGPAVHGPGRARARPRPARHRDLRRAARRPVREGGMRPASTTLAERLVRRWWMLVLPALALAAAGVAIGLARCQCGRPRPGSASAAPTSPRRPTAGSPCWPTRSPRSSAASPSPTRRSPRRRAAPGSRPTRSAIASRSHRCRTPRCSVCWLPATARSRRRGWPRRHALDHRLHRGPQPAPRRPAALPGPLPRRRGSGQWARAPHPAPGQLEPLRVRRRAAPRAPGRPAAGLRARRDLPPAGHDRWDQRRNRAAGNPCPAVVGPILLHPEGRGDRTARRRPYRPPARGAHDALPRASRDPLRPVRRERDHC